MVGSGANDADFDAFVGVPSGESIDDVEVLAGIEVVLGSFAIDFEGVLVDGDVDVTPPDDIFRGRVLGDALILWRASGFFSGVGDECSKVRETGGWLVANRLHVESGDGGIPDDVFRFDSVSGKVDQFHVQALALRMPGQKREFQSECY